MLDPSWDWWCDSTPDPATGGLYGVADRCYWVLGSTITELASGAATNCPMFSLASPLDVFLLVAVHMQWLIGLFLAFLQWYGIGAPETLYYRVAIGGGSLVNLGAIFVLSHFVMPQPAPYWPMCGARYALPAFATQTMAFFTGILALATSRAGGCSSYQLSVSSGVFYLVALARVVLGYNSGVQVVAGAVFGVTIAIIVDAASVLIVNAITRVRSRRLGHARRDALKNV